MSNFKRLALDLIIKIQIPYYWYLLDNSELVGIWGVITNDSCSLLASSVLPHPVHSTYHTHFPKIPLSRVGICRLVETIQIVKSGDVDWVPVLLLSCIFSLICIYIYRTTSETWFHFHYQKVQVKKTHGSLWWPLKLLEVLNA